MRLFNKVRIGAVVHYVADIKRTEAFYRDVLGLDTELMSGGELGSGCLTATAANDIELIFFEAPGKPGASPIVVFTLDDGGIDAAVAQLAKNGATIVTPVSHSPGGWSVDFVDPDGHTLSVYQTEDKPR